MNAPASALGQDADLVHGFLAPFGMDLEQGSQGSTGRMQPFQPAHPHATFIEMHRFFGFSQMLFDLCIYRCHLPGYFVDRCYHYPFRDGLFI